MSERASSRHLDELVSAYLDGELPLPERRQAEFHLAGCDVCRDELTDMIFVRARLRGLPMLETPPEAAPAEPAPSGGLRRGRVLVGAAAAAVGMVLALAAGTSPGDVVALSGQEFSMSYRARATLDQNQTGRMVPLENLLLGDSDSGVNG